MKAEGGDEHVTSSNPFFDIVSQKIGKMTCSEHFVWMLNPLILAKAGLGKLFEALHGLIDVSGRDKGET